MRDAETYSKDSNRIIKMMLKLLPKRSKNRLRNHPTNYEKKHRNLLRKIRRLSDVDPIVEPVAWHFPAVARFVCDLLFGISGGSPLDWFWHPLGDPWSDVLGANLLPMSKILEQQMTTPPKTSKDPNIPIIGCFSDVSKNFSIFGGSICSDVFCRKISLTYVPI